MKIAVIGTGYVGLVAGTCFAESGNDVICVDVDEKKIQSLQEGIIPIYEPGLKELVLRNQKEERLKFTTDLKSAIQSSLLLFIAVGTPPQEDGTADLKYVLAVAKTIGENITEFKVVVNKSTVPVGTAKKVRDTITNELISRNVQIEFDVVSNPEFMKEGAAIEDFMKPDRVVIGVDNVRTGEIMKELYDPFVRTGKPILVMDNASAEMTKYAANSMLATKISFMNEVANLCERVGADVDMVRKGIGTDSRIGFPFIFPGVGYGGSCFPKDIKALIQTGAENEVPMPLLNSVDTVNNNQKFVLIPKILNHFFGDIKGKTIAVWGLAFKPKTDDMREAPSINIIQELLKHGATVNAYDPVAEEQARNIFGDSIVYCDKNYDCLEKADALVLVTEWDEFRRPDWEKMKELMNSPVIFDGRNIFDPTRIRDKGFTYYSIGRP